MKLYFFSDAAFRPLRDQFVDSVADSDFDLQEAYVEDLRADPERAAGGPSVYLFKTRLLLGALEAAGQEEVFVISDVDVQLLGEVAPLVHQFATGLDVCFQREFHELGVNIGFMAVRRTDACLAFWRTVLEEIGRVGGHDQRIVNNLLHRQPKEELGLRWGRFPPEIWASSQALDGGAPPKGVLVHHANWVLRDWQAGEPNRRAPDLPSKVRQLQAFRQMVQASDGAGQEQLAADLAADPQLALYHRRSFGDRRPGPEWASLPEGHPARKGGSRREVKLAALGA